MIRVFFNCSLHFGLVWSILQYEGFFYSRLGAAAARSEVKSHRFGGGDVARWGFGGAVCSSWISLVRDERFWSKEFFLPFADYIDIDLYPFLLHEISCPSPVCPIGLLTLIRDACLGPHTDPLVRRVRHVRLSQTSQPRRILVSTVCIILYLYFIITHCFLLLRTFLLLCCHFFVFFLLVEGWSLEVAVSLFFSFLSPVAYHLYIYLGCLVFLWLFKVAVYSCLWGWGFKWACMDHRGGKW